MKKVLSLFALSAVLFSSCSSFLEGSDLKNNINKAIEEANAPVVSFFIDQADGKTTPFGEQTVKTGVPFTIQYDNKDGYVFKGWKVTYSSSNRTEIDDYRITGHYSIENVEKYSETKINITFYSDEYPYTVRPRVYKRPAIHNVRPADSPEGVCRDQSIWLIFDTDIEINSFYFTDKELESYFDSYVANGVWNEGPYQGLKPYKEPSDIDNFKQNCLIKNSEGKCYAIKAQDDNAKEIILYKNLKITDFEDSSIYLTEYYGAPYLKGANTVVIPTNKDNLPPKGSEVKVTVSENVYTTYLMPRIDSEHEPEIVPVNMEDDYWFNFYINDKDPEPDTQAPEITSCTITSNQQDSTSTFYDKFTAASLVSADSIHERVNQLKLDLSLTDNKSGIKEVALGVKKAYSYDKSSDKFNAVADSPVFF